jgi:hypothetical protein
MMEEPHFECSHSKCDLLLNFRMDIKVPLNKKW